jgi:23S rRNA (cytidine1920-2'-O)/16S rRNA (cytidine1409-2'-O)-methyltransferase
LREALRQGARVVALVKPQFEAGRSAVGRGGVVRDRATHVGAIDAVAGAFAAAGLTPVKLTYSPIVGPAGNIEFLIGAVASEAGDASPESVVDLDSAGVVAAAHETLAR